MKRERKVPRRRFREFVNDDICKEKKLGEVSVSFEYGLNASATKFDGKNKYIRITDIDDESREFQQSDLTSPSINLTNADNYRLKKGDILFARTGASVGKTYIYKESDGEVYYAGFLIRARIKEEYDEEFIFQNTLTDKYKKYISITSQRSGQPGVNAQEYAQFSIKVPSFDEQRRIGTFFRNIENLIILNQHKLEKLKALKKAYLTQMFPSAGECKPKLRFAGFDDEWEQCKVKDICEISTGKSNTQDKIAEGIYPFYVRSPIIERSNKYLYDEEAVLTVGDGVGTGKVYHYVNGKYDLHQRVYRMFGFNKGVIGKYFYHYFSNHFYNRVMSMTAKTSVDSVRLEMISEMNIVATSIEEQKKIAKFLDDINKSIDLHQRKLQKLQNLKKAYLTEMFI